MAMIKTKFSLKHHN